MKDEAGYRLGLWQRRVSRRRVLAGTALGGVGLAPILIGAVGCAQEARPTGPGATSVGAAPAAKQPKKGGTLARAGGSGGFSFDTLGSPYDPHISQTNATKNHRLVYQGLLGYDLGTLEVQPDLAQSWEQPLPTEYIFNLAPGVKWHNRPPANGRDLKVEDVVFSLERIRTAEPRFIYRSLLVGIDKFSAVDNNKVRVTTKKPSASLLALLSGDPMLVMAPEVVEKAKKFATPEEVVGTGAFILKSIQEGVAGEYVRNPSYWKPELPYLDAVRTQHFPDDQTAFAALLARTIQISPVPGPEIKKYIASQGPDYKPLWYKHDSYIQAIANTQAKPADDPRVARALRLLLDHQEFATAWAEVIGGRPGQHGSIFPTALEAWDVSQEEYARHIFWKQPKDDAAKEAIDLLSAAGFTAANPLQLELLIATIPGIRSAGELVDAQWRRLGRGVVQSKIRLLDQIQATSEAVKGTFSFAVIGNAAALPDPTIYLNQIWRTRGSRNFSRFTDPRVDDLVDRQDGT